MHDAEDIFFKFQSLLDGTAIFFILIALKIVPNGPIDNGWALLQVMAWHLTGDRPLSEPMLTQLTDTLMRH